ncbi:hypothetical protein PENSPDRAFT_581724 [Peniophora sp. CONT]|nr:hypothetical protein PENSPDRAFT_581724 [Peniophora sp. CONT]
MLFSRSSSNISQWTCVAVGLSVFAVYQGVELHYKMHLLGTLRSIEHPETVPYSYEGSDHPSELPLHIPPAAMNVEWPDDQLYGLHEDSEWESLFPRGNGWLTLGPNNTMWVLSMYHQMHCLSVLRHAYVAAKSGTLVYTPGGNGTGVEHHTNHCLTYLREFILCNADTTLEESYLIVHENGFKEHGATGMDMVHRCRDWTKVRDYLEDNFAERLAKGIVSEEGIELFPDDK